MAATKKSTSTKTTTTTKKSTTPKKQTSTNKPKTTVKKTPKRETLNEKEKLKEYEIVEKPLVEDKKKQNIFPIKIIIPSILLVTIFCIIGILFTYSSFEVGDLINIRYLEKSNMNYQVYENNVLLYNSWDKNQSSKLNPSIITKIPLSIQYTFDIKEKSSIIFTPKVLAEIYVVDKKNPENILLKESYDLTEESTETIENKKSFQWNQQIEVPYQEYYNLVKKSNIKKEDSTSYVEVSLLIKYKSREENIYPIKGESSPSIQISLDDENLQIKEKNIDTEKRVNEKPTVHLKSPLYFILGILFGLLAILVMTKSIEKIYDLVDKTKENA